MIERLKEASLYLVLGALLTALSQWLGSPYLVEFYKQNLITLLVALLAINTTTSSVVMTKLREINDATGADFSATVKELKRAIVEQVVLVILAALLLVLMGSKIIQAAHPWLCIVGEGLLNSIFVAAMLLLFDTANSIFVILRYEDHP